MFGSKSFQKEISGLLPILWVLTPSATNINRNWRGSEKLGMLASILFHISVSAQEAIAPVGNNSQVPGISNNWAVHGPHISKAAL
jgi:hypothetical protein